MALPATRRRLKALERENRELGQANEILKKASWVDLVTRTNGVLAINFALAERAMIMGARSGDEGVYR